MTFNENTCFWVQCWDRHQFGDIKALLLKEGVLEKHIKPITERISRATGLNHMWAQTSAAYKYIVLMDTDISDISDNFLQFLHEAMEHDSNIGAAIVPCYQKQKGERVTIAPYSAPNVPINQALKEVVLLTTFNTIIFRNDLRFRFDEAIYGSQIIDVDFGMDLNYAGYKVVADTRTCLAHAATDYRTKGIAYHALVARNRHVLQAKWRNRAAWSTVEEYNSRVSESEQIPSVEELTHGSESYSIHYACRFLGKEFDQCYISPRIDNQSAGAHLAHMRDMASKVPCTYSLTLKDNKVVL